VRSSQFTHAGIRSRIGPTSIARLRRKYQSDHYLQLPDFLHSGLLHLIQGQIERTRFQAVNHRGFGRDLRMEETVGSASLNFLLNDRRLFRFVERVTGCSRIGSFVGAVRRAVPRPRSALGWHNDNVDDRMVSITINLGSLPYEGGVLQIRRSRSKKIVAEVSNTGPGSAVIFPVSPGLEHRNTPVRGAIAKTAFSGWFASKPDFETVFAAKFHSRPSSLAREAVTGTGSNPTAIAPDAVFSVPAQIVSRQMGEDMVLLNLATGESFCLDTVGREIWNLLSRGHSSRATSRAIAVEYGVAVREVANDAQGLIGKLLARGLLKQAIRKHQKVPPRARARR
jgi:Coenzyme PQQ synthesis protein D (PqqD)/2OG-Fe(II) oxygenase superfamily